MPFNRNAYGGFGPMLILCISLFALAMTVLGWRISGLPFLFPMRHTVAAGLLCVSFSLMAVRRERFNAAKIWGFFVVVIAFGALAAQAVRWRQLIDERPTSAIATVVSFIHTALPNSVCLIGIGAALCALSATRPLVYSLVLAALTGAVVTSFAICATLNEVWHIIPASPAFEGEVAVDAVVCFALAGISLWRLSQTRLPSSGEQLTLRRPAIVAAAGAFLSFFVWRFLLLGKTETIADQTNTIAAAVVRTMRSDMADRSSGSSPAAAGEDIVADSVFRAARDIVGSNFQLFVVRDSQVIHSFPNPPRRHEASTVAEAFLPEMGASLRLHPGSQFVRRGASWASHLVLIFGFACSLLLAFCMYLLQTAKQRLTQMEQEVAERRRVEQELSLQAKQLTASNADLDDFARAIGHDLQEPLRSVIGFGELLKRRYASHLDADADEFLGYITDSARRMSTMINGLLTYSRSVYAPEEQERVDLNAILEFATGNLAVAIEESQANIIRTSLPVVRANSLQIVQVFQNIIGNAIKYRRQDVNPVIEIHSAKRSQEHLIMVCDNGAGIPDHLQSQIFGLFKRAHGPEYSGAGVGLAVCKRIVEKHGGRIWVESTLGTGTKFYFTFPVEG